MSKRKKAPAPVKSTMSIGFMSITVNGESGHVVNYSRVEREDGTIEESGRPDGMAAGLPLGEAMEQAFVAAATPVGAKRKPRPESGQRS